MPLLHILLFEVDEEWHNAFLHLVKVGSLADHNVKGSCALCFNCIPETLSLSFVLHVFTFRLREFQLNDFKPYHFST